MQHIILSWKFLTKENFSKQQTAQNHSSDIEFKDFLKLYKEYTEEPYSFLVTNTTLGKPTIKMSISEKIKSIKNKIDQNKVNMI